MNKVMQNLKSLFANNKSKVARNVVKVALVASPLLMAASCEKPKVCVDPENPDCENYDPKIALRKDSARLTAQFRSDFEAMNSDEVLKSAFISQFFPRLQEKTLKDSVNASEGAVRKMHDAYGNPMEGANEEQNRLTNNLEKTCIDWFEVCAKLGHSR
jgi:hypothetical protein